jgi:hypothetical protein
VNRQISNLWRTVFADRGRITGNPEVIPVQKSVSWEAVIWQGRPVSNGIDGPKANLCRKLTLMGYLPYLLRMTPLPSQERPATLSNSLRS